MKKIYFACSIRGGRDDAEIYAQLVSYIKNEAKVLTEIFADGKLTSAGMNKPSQDIWKTDINWIREADAIVAEVTNPSLGVGYEITKAEDLHKPVLALFRDDGSRKLSAMVGGSPHTQTATYTNLDQAHQAIVAFLASLKN